MRVSLSITFEVEVQTIPRMIISQSSPRLVDAHARRYLDNNNRSNAEEEPSPWIVAASAACMMFGQTYCQIGKGSSIRLALNSQTLSS